MFPVIICDISKALFSSFEFYADNFVEFGVFKALFSSFEFYADKLVEFGVFKALSSSFEIYAKKKPKHRHRCQAKKKVQKWRRRALPYELVMKCLCQPRNKPQHLVGPEKPVRWRWKKRKFGLAEVQPHIGLEPSTLDKFCSYDHDFLALP